VRTIRIPMRCSTKIETGQYDNLSDSMLVCALQEIDTPSRYVQSECLSATNSFEFYDQLAAEIGQAVQLTIPPLLVHRQQRIGLGLRNVDHAASAVTPAIMQPI